MSEDENGVCGCIILIIILYAIYSGIKWIIDNYGWTSTAITCGTIFISLFIYACQKTWEDASSLTEKGKLFINFGIVFFVSFLIVSFLAELLLNTLNDETFLITSLLNMGGTSLLLYSGAKKLKSCEIESIESQVNGGRIIMYFGIFWLIFWLILPMILVSYGIMTGGGIVSESLLFVAIPGMVINVTIGKYYSKINVKKGWEDLIDAQKRFNLDKIKFEEQLEKFNLEREEFEEEQREFNDQKKELQKQKKELLKLKDDIKIKTKEIDKQQREIQKARGELEETWKELEDTIKKNPFKLSIKDKLNQDLFIKEIEELKKTKPGDVSSINTAADKIIASIKEELNRQITVVEDEYYYKAFLEYFKKIDGDSTEYDRIRIKYNPTIHIQGERRNKEWAEKRRFELSKIEKSMKEAEKLKEENT